MNKTILSVATMIGTIIGAGVFAIPYVFAQSGVITCLVYFLVVGALAVLLHLFFGEAIVRTKEETRLTGLAGKYLGKKSKILVSAAVFIGTIGSLLVYIILSGEFLDLIFPNFLSVFQWSLISWFLLSFMVFCGTRSVAWIELFLSFILFLCALLFIVVFCAPKISLANFSLFNPSKVFLPFGVFLFSLVGWSAVAEARYLLGGVKSLKKVLLISLFICIVFYIIFGLAISGVTGKATTPEPFQAIADYLGYKIIVVAGIFGFLAVATSYLTLVNYLKHTLMFDYKIARYPSFFLVSFAPLALFVLGFNQFIAIVSFLGAFIGLTEGGAIILVWQKAKKMGEKKPEYSIDLPKSVVFIMIGLLVFGCVAQFLYR
ncbi:MAG: aromatic amino acid transport family protein [Candidatus Pacebacteria bacterium]|nr:aromatic amino acid transport family protein [Candidatus Paceibacterota bacterium]